MHRQKYHYTLLNAVTLLHKIIVTPSKCLPGDNLIMRLSQNHRAE